MASFYELVRDSAWFPNTASGEEHAGAVKEPYYIGYTGSGEIDPLNRTPEFWWFETKEDPNTGIRHIYRFRMDYNTGTSWTQEVWWSAPSGSVIVGDAYVHVVPVTGVIFIGVVTETTGANPTRSVHWINNYVVQTPPVGRWGNTLDWNTTGTGLNDVVLWGPVPAAELGTGASLMYYYYKTTNYEIGYLMVAFTGKDAQNANNVIVLEIEFTNYSGGRLVPPVITTTRYALGNNATAKQYLDLQQRPSVNMNSQWYYNRAVVAWKQLWDDGRVYPCISKQEYGTNNFIMTRDTSKTNWNVTAVRMGLINYYSGPNNTLWLSGVPVIIAEQADAGSSDYGVYAVEMTSGSNQYTVARVQTVYTTDHPIILCGISASYGNCGFTVIDNGDIHSQNSYFYDRNYFYNGVMGGYTQQSNFVGFDSDTMVMQAGYKIYGINNTILKFQYAVEVRDSVTELSHTLIGAKFDTNYVKSLPLSAPFVGYSIGANAARFFSGIYNPIIVPLTNNDDNTSHIVKSMDNGMTWTDAVDLNQFVPPYTSTDDPPTYVDDTSMGNTPIGAKDSFGNYYLFVQHRATWNNWQPNYQEYQVWKSVDQGMTYSAVGHLPTLLGVMDDQAPIFGFWPFDVCSGPNGDIHIIGTDDNTWTMLVYAKYTAATNTWSYPEYLVSPPEYGSTGMAAITAAPDGTVHIFHWDWDKGDNYYGIRDPNTGVWTLSQYPDQPFPPNAFNATRELDNVRMQCDATGKLHVLTSSYDYDNEWDWEVRYLTRDPNGTWTHYDTFSSGELESDPATSYYGVLGIHPNTDRLFTLVQERLTSGSQRLYYRTIEDGVMSSRTMVMSDFNSVYDLWAVKNIDTADLYGSPLTGGAFLTQMWDNGYKVYYISTPDTTWQGIVITHPVGTIEMSYDLSSILEITCDPLTMTPGQTTPLKMIETDLIPDGSVSPVYRKLHIKNTRVDVDLTEIRIVQNLERAFGVAELRLAEAGDDLDDARAYTGFTADLTIYGLLRGETKAIWVKWSLPSPMTVSGANTLSLDFKVY